MSQYNGGFNNGYNNGGGNFNSGYNRDADATLYEFPFTLSEGRNNQTIIKVQIKSYNGGEPKVAFLRVMPVSQDQETCKPLTRFNQLEYNFMKEHLAEIDQVFNEYHQKWQNNMQNQQMGNQQGQMNMNQGGNSGYYPPQSGNQPFGPF